MTRGRLFLGFLALAVFLSCGPVPDPRSGEQADLHPPTIESVYATGPNELSIQFDEEASLVSEKTRISPVLSVREATGPSRSIVVRMDEQTPGLEYTLEGEAADKSGNVASFMASFYGFNPKVPRLVLNEFTTQGTTDHPDMLEIKVLANGDMGGVVLYQGTPGSFDDRLVFPSFAVKMGNFIVVHFKPSGDGSEVNETSDTSVSGGIDACPAAYDFWVAGGRGISGNNGVLSIYERPGGKPIDGVLYSNRTTTSDEKYRGFGSAATLTRAEELVRDGGWRVAGSRVTPEDAVNPDGSTSTRSLCRSSTSADTDCADDWHIVPTRGSTFGAENSDEVYTPQAAPK
ncbi:MAG TPA: hypothetical protein VMU36_01485 [Spirochaetia bacterium]|nr:hypothetical protein [Spirochaetia bacterium]